VKYKHTNIIARDWRKLAQFYQEVFGCVLVPPERDIEGEWLDILTGVPKAHLKGAHLLLPGYGDDGPTLEIFQYTHSEPKPTTKANREGIMHLAFEVDNIEEVISAILKNGGSKVGDITSYEIEGIGQRTLIYLADPEGNIIELQSLS